MDNPKISDEAIAERLRQENPSQFNTLVRMHLSFQLDLNTEENDLDSIEKSKEKKWKPRRLTKVHSKSKDSSNEANSTLRSLRSIRSLIGFLDKEENLTQEGIFRKTGSLSRQNELKIFLYQNEDLINLNDKGFTAHDCASVLKSVLADFPEPLLTEVYYPAYCQVAEIYNTKDSNASDRSERIMHTLQLLFLLLPQENSLILHDVIKLLNTTVVYQETNKMSADNLATLFTPHLICPKKLSPESLHTTAAFLSGIISFMIANGSKLFHTPPKLATDIRVYFMEKLRRPTMTPDQILDESSTSDSTAKTIFSFVDREKTAEAHLGSSTETALAQLYAHIQTLPESSKKKRLIKKFNHENGNGTPMLNKEKNASIQKCGKSFSASIKKHIFTKNVPKTPKRGQTNVSPFNTPNTSVLQPISRILFPNINSTHTNSPNYSDQEGENNNNVSLPNQIKSLRLNLTNSNDCDISNESINAENDMNLLNESRNIFKKKNINSYDDMNDEDIRNIDNNSYFSHDNKIRFKSEPNLSKSLNMDDELVIDSTPTSLRETNNNKLKTFFTNKIIKGMSMGNLKLPFMHESNLNIQNKNPEISPSISSTTSNSELSANDNKIDIFKINTTDPKMEWGFNDLGLSTPVDRKSMSPITKSTQRMPKAMQESIMTPRSRKPVMLLGSISNSSCDPSNAGYSKKRYTKLLEEDEQHVSTEHEEMNLYRPKEMIGQMNDTGIPVDSLTNTFRDYLYSRSLQTASPTDLSFSSQPDDFVSTTEVNDMSENDMTDSMLFCMNGNKPLATDTASSVVDEPKSRMGSAMRKRHAEDEEEINEVLLLDETSL